MKAWQFVETGEPLEIAEYPDPAPSAGQVVVDVKTCGLCHSDVSIQYNPLARRSLPIVPLILGHEIAGVVSSVGDDVTEWEPGDRVAVWSTPRTPSIPGFTRHGGYAEKHLAPASDLVAIPDGVEFAQASYTADAAMTAYAGVVRRGRVQEGDRVGIIGYGGLGQVGARIAHLKGATVYIADTKEASRDAAAANGFEHITADASEWRGQNLDLVVDYAGHDTTLVALESVRQFGGRVVQVGANKDDVIIRTSVMLRDRELLGSFGGLKDDLEAVLALVADGTLELDYTEIGFEEVNDGLVRLHDGDVTGRLVARIAT